ncbi:MAG: NRDE family protein [Hydrogenophaga sp.]
MCLIAFAIGAHPDYPLLIAGNRDEFFERPTAPLHQWTVPGGTSSIWAGRDLRDGGTWLGFADNGRIAMLTNVRSARAAAGARSRGELPMRWLAGQCDLDELASTIDPAAYGGFNLVVGDFRAGHWAWLSNRSPQSPHTEAASTGLHRQPLGPGIYGLSNAALDTPWPKTERLKAAVRHALGEPHHDDARALLASALADTHHAPPHQQPATGVPREMEHALSSPFIDMAERGYGTRSSLVAHVRRGPQAAWYLDLNEWTHPGPSGPQRHGWGTQPPVNVRIAWA